jgi:hypothetical protein
VRHPIIFALTLLATAAHTRIADSGRPVPPSLMGRATPTALTTEEEQSAALVAIARAFNPAMALPIRDVWPVEMRYAWHDGANLVARTQGGDGPRETVAVPNAALETRDWSRLPHKTRDGHAIRYYIDAPGDDRIGESGVSRWRERFRAIAMPEGDTTAPESSPYRPTQYVHAFWWNRDEGLLALQYWFYYPFNEWVNHHEGDWERIQVIVKGPSRISAGASFAPVGHHYFFHEFVMEPGEVIRFKGADPAEEHPLVYVGGRSNFLGFGGVFSGGSYPWPGRYPGAGFDFPWLSPAEDIAPPARFLAAEQFQLIIMPEPERLDAGKSPELSWMRLPFYAGQPQVFVNPPGFADKCGRPPLQPAARRDWKAASRATRWSRAIEGGTPPAAAFDWPRTWTANSTPPRRLSVL